MRRRVTCSGQHALCDRTPRCSPHPRALQDNADLLISPSNADRLLCRISSAILLSALPVDASCSHLYTSARSVLLVLTGCVSACGFDADQCLNRLILLNFNRVNVASLLTAIIPRGTFETVPSTIGYNDLIAVSALRSRRANHRNQKCLCNDLLQRRAGSGCRRPCRRPKA